MTAMPVPPVPCECGAVAVSFGLRPFAGRLDIICRNCGRSYRSESLERVLAEFLARGLPVDAVPRFGRSA